MAKTTHAGGVVFKPHGNEPLYLILTAKSNPGHWVLPKGHIEKGETEEQTALREIREEGGVNGKVRGAAGATHFHHHDEDIRTEFYIVERESDIPPVEDRQRRWCTYKKALDLLTFDDQKNILRNAHPIVLKALQPEDS